MRLAVSELLAGEIRAAGVDPARLTALDFGAGNGMVAERLANLGVGTIIGVDLLTEARDAAPRDRPGLYDDYRTLDLARLGVEDRRDLMRHDFDVMTCIAALGFNDIPPLAFAQAINLVSTPGWIAFNIRDRFLSDRRASGFASLVERMFRDGVLIGRARMSYTHRVSVSGKPLEYVAVIAEKQRDVPMSWARAARA